LASEHRIRQAAWTLMRPMLSPRLHSWPAREYPRHLHRRGTARYAAGNSPGTKWVAFNAVAEHLDYGRRYTARTNQVQRSFEDTALKQRALELVVAA
jgi:hypothetical protein